jgi:aspartate racemase
MKTIGMLGGMSWESTQSYYQILNQVVKRQLGGLHSARIIMFSVDFAEIEALQHQGDWDRTAQILAAAARSVESAGADFLIICTNTMHKVAPQIQRAINIPVLHIAEATARVLLKNNIRRVGLLGTKFTMEQNFYREIIEANGIEVLIPDDHDRHSVHEIIYRELCLGEINSASRLQYLGIIDRLAERGADAVILGCTEISLLVKPADTRVLLFDTTAIHAEQAALHALDTES